LDVGGSNSIANKQDRFADSKVKKLFQPVQPAAHTYFTPSPVSAGGLEGAVDSNATMGKPGSPLPNSNYSKSGAISGPKA
jgi:hypothetical protein